MKEHVIQLFTDFDDTLVPAGDSLLAGEDRARSSERFYPGVEDLHRAVQTASGLPSVVATAAPHLFFSTAKQAILSRSGLAWRVSCGSLVVGLQTFLALGWRLHQPKSLKKQFSIFAAAARDKAVRIEALSRSFSRTQKSKVYVPVFIGDSGQGDLLTALWCLSKGVVELAFIHVVQESTRSFLLELLSDDRWRPLLGRSIRFFRDTSEVHRALHAIYGSACPLPPP